MRETALGTDLISMNRQDRGIDRSGCRTNLNISVKSFILAHNKVGDTMPRKDKTGPPSGAKGPRTGKGGGQGNAPGKGTGPKTGGKKGGC